MERTLRSVSVLSAGVGAGHMRAAHAVATSLGQGTSAPRVQVQDVLEHATAGFRTMYRDTYVAMAANTPRLVGWLYDRADAPWAERRYARMVERLALRGWMRRLLRDPPDAIVCTHFLPASLVHHLRTRHGLRSSLTTVVTDLDVHGLWLDGTCDHWCVAGNEAGEIVRRAGVPGHTVHVTGIPIAEEFRHLPTREAARRHLGVPLNRPLILFSTGGCCLGPVEQTFGSLQELAGHAMVVAICGHNRVAHDRLQRMVPADMGDAVRVVGLTHEMHHWMAAADLLVGKPGGLTSSEARAAGLPMVAIHPIPGQEERNLAHLLEWGAAIACHTPATLSWRIERLLADPARMAAMRKAARDSAYPDAASTVAAVVRHAADPARSIEPSATLDSAA
jgi:processive 1,2-diacylglycerol beta-glucosyltransferase